MNRPRRCLSTDDARPAEGQHERPCGDCPWARASLAGWLGALSRDEWLWAAHGEDRIDCHTLSGAQCAGAAIYRRNVCKVTQDPALLRLPPDKAAVFASPGEFRAHHERKGEP